MYNPGRRTSRGFERGSKNTVLVIVNENGLFCIGSVRLPVRIGLNVEEHSGLALGSKCLCLCLLFRLNLFLRHLFLLGKGHETDVWELIHSANRTRNADHEFLRLNLEGNFRDFEICLRVYSNSPLLLV